MENATKLFAQVGVNLQTVVKLVDEVEILLENSKINTGEVYVIARMVADRIAEHNRNRTPSGQAALEKVVNDVAGLVVQIERAQRCATKN
jgi:hypothetical protein